MTYKIRKQRKTKAPIPLPELIPGRGHKPWEIKDVEPGYSSCKYTEEGGSLSVPLAKELCDECGKDHAAAARLHEMAHAAISPQTDKNLRNHFKLKGEKYTVSNEAITLAEEMRAHYYADKIAERRRINYDSDCYAEDVKYMEQLIENHDFREFTTEMLSRSTGLNLANQALTNIGYRSVAIFNDDDDATQFSMKQAVSAHASQIVKKASKIKEFAAKNYGTNVHSWSRQLQIAYATDQLLDAVKDHQSQLKLALDKLKNPPPPRDPSELPDDDLARPQAKFKSPGIGREEFFQKLGRAKTLNKVMEPVKDNRSVVWGKMRIEEPPRTRKLPLYKNGWKPRATAEGSVPQYMHRWPIDNAIFRSRRRVRTGSVLIDVSGSMSFTREELEELVAAAPGGIVALYSGVSNTGTLRIIGKDGKYINPGKDAWNEPYPYDYGMGGNNVIDKPALEWLAEQPLPRIWVSDGMVVPAMGTYSVGAWDDCEKVMLKNRINRVETAEQARLALEGKLALWR